MYWKYQNSNYFKHQQWIWTLIWAYLKTFKFKTKSGLIGNSTIRSTKIFPLLSLTGSIRHKSNVVIYLKPPSGKMIKTLWLFKATQKYVTKESPSILRWVTVEKIHKQVLEPGQKDKKEDWGHGIINTKLNLKKSLSRTTGIISKLLTKEISLSMYQRLNKKRSMF